MNDIVIYIIMKHILKLLHHSRQKAQDKEHIHDIMFLIAQKSSLQVHTHTFATKIKLIDFDTNC